MLLGFLREAYFREQFDMFDNDDIYFQLAAPRDVLCFCPVHFKIKVHVEVTVF